MGTRGAPQPKPKPAPRPKPPGIKTIKKETSMKFELGIEAKDIITGFTGTITGFVKYLTGCDQYLLAPKVDIEGKHVNSRWYDVNRIEEVPGKKQVQLDVEEDKGACEPAPLY